jgi:hypothetical protein
MPPVPESSPLPPVPSEPEQPKIPPPPPGANKKSLIIGATALAVLLLGGGAAAYFLYPLSPEKVLAQMTESLPKITSSEFSGKLEFDLVGDVGGLPIQSLQFIPPDTAQKRQIKFTLDFEGKSETSDIDHPKSSGSFKLSGEGLVVAAEMVSIGKIFYFRLTEAPFLGFIDPGTVKNQWFHFDSGELEEQGIRSNADVELTQEQEDRITDAFSEAEIFKVLEKLPGEQIEGVAAHHYRIEIDEAGLAQFVKQVGVIMDEPMTEQESQEFARAFDMIEFRNTEIWVGRKDSLPYKLVMNLLISSTEDTQMEGTMALSMNMKNYNRPVAITAPSPSKDIMEMFGSGLTELPAPSNMPMPPVPEFPDFQLPPDFESEFDLELEPN